MRQGGRGGFRMGDAPRVKQKPTQNDKLEMAIRKMKKKQAADALAQKETVA